ncbi:site-specific integrase [Mycobacterium kansasii]|uniref:tyrosine-type recombinase/integrase n=1 Tax=Mycobacterium kansasii TaxID=1768 RepID=UPI000CDE11D5|nr:tyrosine-type recombinase/integrase [Mycobacterium kansasii]POX98886.1 site-specific integrase [Mycobacterium kansasii]POY25303.1 site-specific integrase [Mycobacterium kansasii]POY31343.1 site-specific integrase [Mycobacterium kansasii]
MTRQQLPPQIKKVRITDRKTGKAVVRYQVTVDTGVNPQTGRRQQARRRYTTEREARTALVEIADAAAKGRFVSKSTVRVDQLCADYLAGRHKLRPSSRAKLEYDLAPLRERYGQIPVQRLTKGQIDALVTDLIAGGTRTAKGRQRKPWSAESVNKVVASVEQVLSDAKAQGIVGRNVAELVNRVSKPHKVVDTYTEVEVHKLLVAITDDRLAHAWELALSGLRRGEIAGLRWADVDLASKMLSITNNRVSAGGKTTENDPKSPMSRRTLPLPDRLVAVLKAAKARQAAERLALGRDGGAWSYVVSNEIGEPYSPAVLSRYWRDTVKAAGVRHIKLHAARHTCATLMHLSGVPVAVIAAWIGHKDASLTMKLYAHSQDDALKAAGDTLNRVVTSRDSDTG